MTGDEITLGEIVRRQDRIEEKIDNGIFVRMDLLRAKEEAIDRRLDGVSAEIAELRGWQVWATRMLIGAAATLLIEAVALAFAILRSAL